MCIRDSSIMDAVIGMEGDGPTSGTERFVGLVMASADPFILDMAACGVIGYAPEEVDTVRIAAERGHTPRTTDELTVLGLPINEVMIPDYVKPESHFNLLKLINLPSALNARVVSMRSSRPGIDYKKCVSCGECARCCPPKAISMESGAPVIDRQKCIKCFCCQELCPKLSLIHI